MEAGGLSLWGLVQQLKHWIPRMRMSCAELALSNSSDEPDGLMDGECGLG